MTPTMAPKAEVPSWLQEHGIKKGGYYTTTKARTKRVVSATNISAGALRLHSLYDLHTMAYRQEKAVTQSNDQRVDLTPGMVAKKLKWTKQKFTRYQTELENAGLSDRGEIVPGKGLVKGNIEIYSFAVPREPKTTPENDKKGNGARLPFENLGEEFQQLTTFLKRYKIAPDFVPSRDDLLQMQEDVAELEKAISATVARIKGRCANEDPIRKERTGKNSKEDTVCQSSSGEEEPPPDRQTEPPPPPPEPEPEPAHDPVDEELDAVMAEAALKIRKPNQAVEVPGPTLRAEIRRQLSGAPPHQLRQRANQRMKPGDSLGKLIPIAKDIGGIWRTQQRQMAQEQAEEEQRNIVAWIEIVNDPNESEDIRERCREQLRMRGVELNE